MLKIGPVIKLAVSRVKIEPPCASPAAANIKLTFSDVLRRHIS